MINITGITRTIEELDLLYNTNPTQSLYYSKLALLELCGWLEQTIDDIINECAKSKLSVESSKTFFEKNIINPTYGFHYEKHFRPMLMNLIGLIALEKIESKLVESGELSILTSLLGVLIKKRNEAAHTSVTGITPIFDAPSVIRHYLNRLHPILSKIESKLNGVVTFCLEF